jgi:hypothetical protein
MSTSSAASRKRQIWPPLAHSEAGHCRERATHEQITPELWADLAGPENLRYSGPANSGGSRQ